MNLLGKLDWSAIPFDQPIIMGASIRTTAGKPYRTCRTLDLTEVDGAACAADSVWQEFGMRRDPATIVRRPHG